MAVKGVALGCIAVGAVFTYAGLTGRNIPAAIRAVISGKSPSTAPVSEPITGSTGPPGSTGQIPGTSGGPAATTVLGSAIVADAVKYIGKLGWTFGGTMNSGSPDCSGFVNGVLGRDLGLAVPGYKPGTFDGSTHGASSFMYLGWGGAVSIPRSSVSPGDLCVWVNAIGHIGIAVDNTTLVSDLNSSIGVQETPIDGTDSGSLHCLRLKAVIASGNPGGPKK